ncbi:MAG: divalent metal cation transporter, partial [Firmicutes bacterium]|nr:divalent metal cation transporter [Bacillota bacterium]
INLISALVWSQVVLSFILPAPIIQMLVIAGKRGVMGRFVNTKAVRATGVVITVLIVALNLVLIVTAL